MYRPVLKLLIIQQFALLLKSLFVIFSTFLIYGQSCNGHQKLIFSFLYKLPLIVDESHSNFFALPNLLYMRFRLTIEPFSEFVCFLQRLFSTCLMGVLCDLKLSTKGRTIAKLKFHFASRALLAQSMVIQLWNWHIRGASKMLISHKCRTASKPNT